MSKIKDYLDKLSISNAYNPELMVELLEKFYSKKRALSIYEKWSKEMQERLYNPDSRKMSNIYSLMNEDLYSSLVLTGGSDYDRYVYQGEWLENHIDFLGKRIIDLGCMNGLMTCFIAFLCPENEVIGVDFNKPAITIAKKLAKILGLLNVKFIFAPYTRISGVYDTIYTSLFSHETFDLNYYSDYETMSEEEKTHYWSEKISPCFSKISSLLVEGGNAICFEREFTEESSKNGLYKAFSDNGLLLLNELMEHKQFFEDDIVLYYLQKNK